MSKKLVTLKPEVIKPGLNVQVDWYGDQRVFYPGKVIKKRRKNWLLDVAYDFDFSNKRKVSVPHDRLTVDVGITKEGRQLRHNEKDKKIFFSQEHIDYCKSLCVEDPRGIVNEKGVRV